MEIFEMTPIHAATAVAMFITTTLGANVLVVGARGPLTPRLSARLRSTTRRLGRRTKRFVDTWVAAMLSHSEQQASSWVESWQQSWSLPEMSDRDLRDIGLTRVRISRGDVYAGHMSPADARAVFSVAHPLEEGVQ
jgi:uncharacterized protein YjiS (DUF1127 family)